MKKTTYILIAIFFVVLLGTGELLARGKKEGPVIYITSQGLLYDSIIAASRLPMKGPFQLLYECDVEGSTGLCTEFGPGDFGFYGGRWWLDDGDGEMEADDDSFFSCPLLGPGREIP
jgi:hypothetical protein